MLAEDICYSDGMALAEVGRVCIKKFGRDAGARAVITKVIDSKFVSIVTGERKNERRCNVRHLEFLNEKVDTKDKEQVAKILEIEASKLPVIKA